MILFAIFLFYKSLFVTYEMPDTINREVLSEKKEFNKLIYIVLDGLRFDALVPVKKNGYYYNNMTFINNDNIHKHVFLSIAGIPTATSSRIKGLMTGAPNSRIDLLQAFMKIEIKIDNMTNRYKNNSIAFFGDSLWSYTFKNLKNFSETLCSFSKDNLVENENIIFNNMLSRIKNNQPDYLFAHFISLDSYGHTYGIDNEIMQKTLKRFNDYLEKVYNEMSDDTLMVVVSDHGVTDEGSHSGSSLKELASIGCFLSKKKILTYEFNLILQKDYLKKFYDLEICNTQNDWIMARNKYDIIHQDDIVITTSYLLGIPIPYNSYGNLIPKIVNNESVYEKLAEFKFNKISDKAKYIKKTDLVKYNYDLSYLIYLQYSQKSFILGILPLIIFIYLLYELYKKTTNTLKFLHILFMIIMVSCSYWSFASEDYIWFFSFIWEHFNITNIIAFLIYFKIPGRKNYEVDKIFASIRKLEFCKNFNIELTLLITFFFLWKLYRKKIVFINLPQSIFTLIKFYFNIKNKNVDISFLSAFLSLESLVAVHLNPLNAFYVLFILPNLEAKIKSSSNFSLLQLLVFICDLENAVQGINFNIFYLFTDKYDLSSASVSAVSYFFLPRFITFLNFKKFLNIKNHKRNFNLPFLLLLNLFICFLSSWFMHNTLPFDRFFLGRLLFVTGHSIADLFIYYLTTFYYDLLLSIFN